MLENVIYIISIKLKKVTCNVIVKIGIENGNTNARKNIYIYMILTD